MRLHKLKLNNFRSFGSEETVHFENLTAIIGSNSSGKSALMQALLKLFGESSVERDITRSDFHLPKGVNPEEIEENNLSIEAVFTFPELTSDVGLKKYTIPLYFENFVVESPGEPPYLRIKLEACWKKSNSPEGIVESRLWYIVTPEGNEVTDSDKKKVSKYELSHIKVIYVPAMRNPSTQLKNATGTILWRVLKGINWTDEVKKEISESISTVNDLFDNQIGIKRIKGTIKEQWQTYHQDSRYNNAEIIFNSTEIEEIMKKVEVEFSPTETVHAYKVDALGDGLRSLFYLSLVSSFLEIENESLKQITEHKGGTESSIFNFTPPALTIVAIEEPENHIAPQLLGKVINNLRKIATYPNSQTILTSHTASIIKRIDPTEIRHLRICQEEQKTVISTILLPTKDSDSFTYVKEAVKAYPELYFARLVVLGEGDSEEIILTRVLETLGHDIDSSGISIVPLGGRHVNHMWRLLDQLKIPYITLLDLDLERSGGGWGRIKYVLEQLISLGHDKKELLTRRVAKGGSKILTDSELRKMHEREINIASMNSWLKRLKKYNVYFSSPLDIDFMMLEAFTDEYLQTIEGNEGPFIKGKGKVLGMKEELKTSPDFVERVLKDVRATLKEEGGDGDSYSEYQKELMIWYNYFFLNRGKPSTHILALSKINDSLLEEKLPNDLRDLREAVKEMLIGDHLSKVSKAGDNGE